MFRVGVTLTVLAAVLPAAGVGATSTAPQPVLGADVSFPQCGGMLPAHADVAIVGVNDGLANGLNPCLDEQLLWARTATAGAASGTDAVQLYVNTGNPGHAASWWPTADTTRSGAEVHPDDGDCTGGEDAACAYVYGYSIAQDDLARVANSTAARWWLDVETINSWSADRLANRASVEGMVDAFAAAGVPVGLYSTARQWTAVVGEVGADGPLAGIPSWLAGAVTVAGAQARCDAPGLTPGSRVVLAQYVAGGVDGDVVCGAEKAPATAPAERAQPHPDFWARLG